MSDFISRSLSPLSILCIIFTSPSVPGDNGSSIFNGHAPTRARRRQGVNDILLSEAYLIRSCPQGCRPLSRDNSLRAGSKPPQPHTNQSTTMDLGYHQANENKWLIKLQTNQFQTFIMARMDLIPINSVPLSLFSPHLRSHMTDCSCPFPHPFRPYKVFYV